MYLIDHVAELRFVNRLIYAIKRIGPIHTQLTSAAGVYKLANVNSTNWNRL